MKKTILKLILLNIILLLGVKQANAAAYSIAAAKVNGGLAANPVTFGSTNYSVFGFSLTGTNGSGSATNITSLTFSNVGASWTANGNGNNSFFTTAYIYKSPLGAAYVAGVTNTAGNLIGTATSDGTANLVFNGIAIPISSGLTAANATYYVVFADDAVTAANQGAYQLEMTACSSTNVTGLNSGATTGTSYTFTGPPVYLDVSNSTLAGTNSLNSVTQTQQAILGFAVATSGLTTISSMTFTPTTSAGTMANYFTNVKLYVSTTDNVSAATLVTGTTVSSLSGSTITVSGLSQAINATTKYYFIKADYIPPTSGNPAFQLSATSVTSNLGTTYSYNGPIPGPSYTLFNGVTTCTAVGVTSGPTNGLLANPITLAPQTGAIYGFGLSNSGTDSSPVITGLTFTTTAPQNDNYYFAGGFTLYSSPTSTYSASTATAVGSAVVSTNKTLSFTGLNIAIPASGTLYYFVVVTYQGIPAASTFQLSFTSATTAFSTTSVAAGTTNTGFAYTITPPTYTITSNASGIQASNVPYYFGSTGDVLESFGVTSNGATQLNTITLTSTLYPTYFSNLTVYASSNPNYAADLAGTGSPLIVVPVTVTGTTTLLVTFNTPQSLSSTPIYYFVLSDFSAGDDQFNNTTASVNFLFNLSAASVTYNSVSVAATNNYSIPSTTYKLLSPIAFGTSNGAGLATANQLNYNQTQVGILGFSLTAAIPETVNTISFSAAINPATEEINAYFSNVKLYYNTTDNASTATAVPAGYTVSAINGKTFTISGLSLNISSATEYFYIKADFTAPTNFTSTLQLSATNCTTTTPLTCTAGTTVDGTVYNISPSVILGNATTTGLAANPVVAGQNGNTLGIFSFSVYSGPANTFTTFNLSSAQPSGQYLGTNFSGYALYVNKTANNFAGATLVTGDTFSAIASSNTLTISGLSQAIPASTTWYYFIKAVFTSPAVATTYELNLNSVATSSTTYTTGGPVNGIDYTLSGPLGVYYWEGINAGGSNKNVWENAKNWLNANTGTTNNGYPDQSVTTDVVVFNINYANTYTITVNSSKTVGQMIVEIGNTSAYDLELANGTTFTVTNGLVLGDPGQVNAIPAPPKPFLSQIFLDEISNNGTGIFYIEGTSTLYNDGSIAVLAPTIFPSGSLLNLYGTSADPSFVGVYGSTLTASSTTFNLTGNGSEIYLDNSGGSTLNATNSTINISGFSSQVTSYGTATFTNCNINTNSISNNAYTTGMVCVNSSMTLTGNTVVNLGTSSTNGNYNALKSYGGTFNISGNTVVNLIGPSSFLTSDSKTQQAIMNINGTVINLGTAAGTNGNGANITNTDGGYFNLNAGAVVNMYGANSAINNTSVTTSGVTNYGVFQAAPTSFINPASTTAVINNTNASAYFTLLSDATASATIGQLPTGAKILGQYDVQRYLNGGASYLRNYRLLSSPVNVTSATSSQYNKVNLSYPGASATIPSIGTVYNGAFILGPDATFGGGNHTIPNPGIYLYQENIVPGKAYNASFTSGKNVGIMSLNSSAATITTKSTAAGAGTGGLPGYDNTSDVSVPPGNAYLMYYIDNNTRTTTAGTASVPNASTVTASGYVNQGQVQLFMWGSLAGTLTDTYGVSGTRLPGITMVGNPYPSTIDLHTVYTDNSHTIKPVMYQLDKVNQQFDSYSATTGLSSSSQSAEYIGSGLGFYIHVDSLGSSRIFAFQEHEKTPLTSPGLYPPLSQFEIPAAPANTVDNVNSASGNIKTDNLTTAGAGSSAVSSTGTSSAPGKTTGTMLASTKRGGTAAAFARPRTLSLSTTDATDTGSTASAVLITEGSPVVKLADNPSVTPEAQVPISDKVVPAIITNPAGLHLKLVADSVTTDEIGVYFNKAWYDKYDDNDSYDLDGLSGKVYLSSFTSDGVRTSVNTMGDCTLGKRVKLYVKAAANGTYQLQLSDMTTSLNNGQYYVYLVDNLKKDSVDLNKTNAYSFDYTVADTGSYANRFVLAIEHKPIPLYALLNFTGQKVTSGVQLNWKTQNEENTTKFVVQKLNTGNNYMYLDSLQSDSAGAYAYVDQHPVMGNNTYRLQQTDALGTITYSSAVTIGYNSTAPNGDLVIYPNPAKTVINVKLNTAAQAATADIYNTSGVLIAHKVVDSNSFTDDVSGYKLGVYILELKNGDSLLIGTSKFVKVQ